MIMSWLPCHLYLKTGICLELPESTQIKALHSLPLHLSSFQGFQRPNPAELKTRIPISPARQFCHCVHANNNHSSRPPNVRHTRISSLRFSSRNG